MRLLALLEYGAILVGAAALVASKLFLAPKAFHLGLFLIGAGLALGGLEAAVSRQWSLRFRADAAEAYAGWPSILWGMMLLVAGGGFIAAAYLMDAGRWSAVVAHLGRRPGPLLAVAGLLVTGCGALTLIEPRRPRGWRALPARIARWALALGLLLAGIAATAAGLLEWMEPREFQRLLRVLPGLR
ncbi:MAG TPA: hypothetical protein VLC55_11495 [Burkholderiales bacterium]|nr:hypothetical protein [Burkholderiales bacterium]